MPFQIKWMHIFVVGEREAEFLGVRVLLSILSYVLLHFRKRVLWVVDSKNNGIAIRNVQMHDAVLAVIR